MTECIHGVNIGGWLVVEKWMTPKLFEGIDAADEFTLMQIPDGKKRIERHRKTFVTEQDFAWLHNHGITLVRIPVGYWLFKTTDGFTPTVNYLDAAFEWAEKYGLQVLIDLHAAQGSQNGLDHSGRAGSIGWYDEQHQTATVNVLCDIATRYKKSPALWGIELLNEPNSKGNYWSLLHFYRRAYGKLRGILPPGKRVVFHDSYRPLLFTGSLWQRKSHPVLMDVHLYSFSAKGSDPLRYIARSARFRKILLKILQLWQPVMVGEWSAMLPERLIKDVPQNRQEDLLRQYVLSQQSVYEHSAGWAYWNYKTENGGMWNFRDMTEKGIQKL